MSWIDRLMAAARPGKDMTPEERAKAAQDLVVMSSMGAAAVTIAPIPLTDFVVVTPVQASMVMGVGRIYGRELSLSQAQEILLELASVCGLSMLAQKGFATVAKVLLPGLGGVLAGPFAFAVTYGVGHVAMRYFADKQATREALRAVFEDAVRRGKEEFSGEKLEEFRKARGEEVAEFAKKAASSEPGGEPGQAPAEEPQEPPEPGGE